MYKAPLPTKFNTYYLKAILFCLSVVIYSLVTSDNKYYLLLCIQFISAFFLFFNAKKVTTYGFLLLVVFPLMLFQYFIHPERFRYSTIFYSFLYLTLFLTYRILLYKNSISLNGYLKYIKLIAYSYLVVLIIQQLGIVFSAPILNISNVINPENKWKLNSLSMEPSNTALIITILLFSYCYCISIVRNKKYNIFRDFKKDKYLWLAYFYICLTTVSASAFFCIPVLALYVARKKDILIVIGFLIFLFIILINNVSLYAFQRVTLFTPALLNLDPIAIFNIDPSAGARLSPSLIYFQQLSIFSSEFWFGYGNDYGQNYLTKYLIGFEPDEKLGIGGMVTFMYDYGIIIFLYFIVIIRKLTLPKFFCYEMFFWFSLIFIIPINHYIQWLFWCVCATNTYFSVQYKRKQMEISRISSGHTNLVDTKS